LRILSVRSNNIGNTGAQALAESLKINVTLENLYLEQNNIGAAGALALAAGLLQNRGLRHLDLSRGSVGDEGRQALEDAEKTKRDRGEDFEISWR
jgi:Ran GTPase-activating protein (RanGAP) involved in mRNA processing and transport